MGLVRFRATIRGIVQGVGFRPFLFRLATELGLAGMVSNTSNGVIVEIEGEEESVRDFLARVRSEAPPLALVEDVQATILPPAGLSGFTIEASRVFGAATTAIPPDVAVCDACIAEMRDPKDRRYRYPFINCTDCGPRFTIIEGVPYDRPLTTMSVFSMCEECRAEYEDPGSRRFHAEPIACPACGPKVILLDSHGEAVQAGDPIAEAAYLLGQGAIVAIKGIGGFHLAADATNNETISRLRRLKQRDRKPFAVMVRSLENVCGLVQIDSFEEKLLRSPASPIVLLRRYKDGGIAPDVAPENAFLGVMLPYTPLHHLLLEDSPPVLVMTSANPHDEPIVRGNDEAIVRLGGIADAFLVHDRDILARCDDSVSAWFAGALRPVRRSRGYVPLPLALPVSGNPVLAVGADLKNTFCVTRGDEAFFGPHVGDLGNAATAEYFIEAVTHLCNLLEVRPSVIAHDMHPDYFSTRLAYKLSQHPFRDTRLVAVQHHHAHVLSCLAENGFTGRALGVAMDGTGYGLDETFWGGEFLLIEGGRFDRVGHLETLPLPGGDIAAREVWRIGMAALIEYGLKEHIEFIARSWSGIDPSLFSKVARLAERGHVLRSSSLGRLFDAASAISGIASEATYEGEAAIALERYALKISDTESVYDWGVREENGRLVIVTRPVLECVLRDVINGVPRPEIARRFHNTVIKAIAEVVTRLSIEHDTNVVALSGGSFQNRLLLEGLIPRLRESQLEVMTQSAVPTNDAGIALGQAMAVLAGELSPP